MYSSGHCLYYKVELSREMSVYVHYYTSFTNVVCGQGANYLNNEEGFFCIDTL